MAYGQARHRYVTLTAIQFASTAVRVHQTVGNVLVLPDTAEIVVNTPSVTSRA
ncbi:hypothetical protein GHT06_011327 [Daphnia sinensis]|uniref:Uncharacterized protein n=1 Tax=Daphnia sinensis TaxID=1820382 RepID=A0AAD5LJG6_9CRUS|nr:hypothetical protein GHT06_011327 [Daphnia sinensis]